MSRAILAGAFLPRPLLLPLPSTLSDDALRYLWGGKVAAAGANPYALPPAAEQLTSLRDEIWRHLPHREIRTIHPPPSIAAFSIAARPPNPIMAALGVVATTATPASEGLVPAKLAPGAALAPPRGRRAVAEAAASLLGRWPSG